MKIRVYYEDTDCGGIVYHSNYLKFCERARSELFFSKGKMPYNQDFGFVVKKIQADFIKSARLGDLLEIHTTILEKKRFFLILKQEISSHGEKIFEMHVKLGFIDLAKGKPAVIKEEFLEVLDANN